MKLSTFCPLLMVGLLCSFVAECEEPEPECESSDYCPPGGSYTITGKVASDCTFTVTSTSKTGGGPPIETGAGAYDSNGDLTDGDEQSGSGPASVSFDSGTKTLAGAVSYMSGPGEVTVDTGYWTPRGK